MSWCLGYGTGGWLMMGTSLVVLALAVWAVARLFPGAPPPPLSPDPMAVLDARLASGDIDLDTHRTLRDELAGRATGRPGGYGAGAGAV
ncbi:hypothetical protein [Cellulomonas carbonis]|uniref:SHOCT domain-containing protein n=1 Tax=Cellulomonas carbonis T26 TaxID=947969 RepID=A0A0A0BM43_9CELL|nr:hypothetical protein [Cellulomonas carbonis]KGM09588.1 hypothetical protein N868_01375 [Cellulomonas carbonis T26]GGC07318.1 hypothetical protein GCM10010972_20820 [Cellulomonas carbonis]